MNFSERNARWDGTKRMFQQLQSRSPTPGYWSIEVKGPNIITEWGRLGGKLQTATETMNGVNLGKKNAKDGAQYALERAREMARKKAELEGYREFFLATHEGGTSGFLDPLIEVDINFDDLPKTLSFYKPDNSMGAGMEKKAEEGLLWYARKRNGLMYVISKGTERAKLYSRRMLRQHDDEVGTKYTWDDRFPDLVEVADEIMPPNSILLGELVMDRQGLDDMAHVQSLTKSLTPQAWQDIQRGHPSYYIWDIAFWDGADLVSKSPVRERYELIDEIDYRGTHGLFLPVQYFDASTFKTPEEAKAYAKRVEWEGFVAVDPDGIYGDRAYNFKGKPDRPGKFCSKVKPSWEDDFVAIWDPDKGYGKRSTKGSRAGGIKSVSLHQYNAKGELVFIADCNSGLTDEFLAANADPSLYPQVWQVEYSGRRYLSEGDESNAIDFPRLVEVRSDKRPAECINERLG